MRKNGFKKDLPALPPREFFHVYKQKPHPIIVLLHIERKKMEVMFLLLH